jgi:biopolymer transport protein ExbD
MFLQADGEIDYGYVVQLMDTCRQAGVEQVALVTKEVSVEEATP